MGGIQTTFQYLKKLFSSELKLIAASDLFMNLIFRRTKATALAKIFVHMRLSEGYHLVAVITDLKGLIRQKLFNFKCKPLYNDIQCLLMFQRLFGVQEAFKISACVQVILNAVSFCPNDPVVI